MTMKPDQIPTISTNPPVVPWGYLQSFGLGARCEGTGDTSVGRFTWRRKICLCDRVVLDVRIGAKTGGTVLTAANWKVMVSPTEAVTESGE